MPSVRLTGMLASVGALALLGATSTAFALVNTYTVGTSTAAGGPCNFSTIKEAVDAAAAHPGLDRIYIATNATYSAQAIVIDNQDLAIVGGFKNCGDLLAPSVNTTINGVSYGGLSVIAISGTSNVSLQYLTITGANKESGPGPGGGIDFVGTGSLDLSNVRVTDNSAGSGGGGGIHFAGSGTLTLSASLVDGNFANIGGGIYVNGTGAALWLKAGTVITDNSAFFGGGIRIEGNARLFILEENTAVEYNTASYNGGGVQVIGPARADIGSARSAASNYPPVFYANNAANGGGVSVEAGDQQNGQDATLRLFSTNAAGPVRMSSNGAVVNGAAIYLKPFSNGSLISGRATVCAHDYRIDNSVANSGSAIYAETDDFQTDGGKVLLQPVSQDGYGCDPETPASLGAVACTDPSCNMIDGNSASLDGSGATISLQTGSLLLADRLKLLSNHGNYVLRTSATDSHLSNCLLAFNYIDHELLFIANGALSIDSCTFADDAIGAADVILNNTQVSLTNSIVYEPDKAVLNFSGVPADLHVAYVLANDVSTLPPGPSIVQGIPLFVDALELNYHLLATKLGNTITASPGIDFAPAVPGDDRDIDGRPRDQDFGAVDNIFGTRDIGAYEMQPIVDRIFADAFGDPVSLVY